ncbi:MAG: hypothetical protein JWL84_1490 [Rhodospirillales bacterium]|jgi:hypothetical protein|nr:hypothetical protein [Rhodospirillales bacterium]
MRHDEQDEVSYEKILEAAKEIRFMAESRPAEASALLAQAHRLIDLAEQIRNDSLRWRDPFPIAG